MTALKRVSFDGHEPGKRGLWVVIATSLRTSPLHVRGLGIKIAHQRISGLK
jgi:hypothetical protein